MVALDPRPSGKLDQVIEIVRPTVADPEGDGVTYGVKRASDLVTNWRIYAHEISGNSITLHLDLGLGTEFEAATGVFPVGTDIFYEDEDGQEQRYTITAFIPSVDPFDYSAVVSIGGQTATFSYAEDLEFAPGLNQKATGSCFVVVELDREFQWPGSNIRTIEVGVGYQSARDGGLFEDAKRKAWARLEANRVTSDGRELELTVADDQVEVGDVILFGGARLTVTEVEAEARSEVRRVTASSAS